MALALGCSGAAWRGNLAGILCKVYAGKMFGMEMSQKLTKPHKRQPPRENPGGGGDGQY
jgi:hypothetical protein